MAQTTPLAAAAALTIVFGVTGCGQETVPAGQLKAAVARAVVKDTELDVRGFVVTCPDDTVDRGSSVTCTATLTSGGGSAPARVTVTDAPDGDIRVTLLSLDSTQVATQVRDAATGRLRQESKDIIGAQCPVLISSRPGTRVKCSGQIGSRLYSATVVATPDGFEVTEVKPVKRVADVE